MSFFSAGCSSLEGSLATEALDGRSGNGVVAGEGSKGSVEAHLLRRGSNLGSLRAGRAGAVRSNIETAPRVQDAVGAGAGGHRIVESTLVRPPVDEIAVKSVSGRVAHGINEPVEILDFRRVEEVLVEDAVDGDGVRLRADTKVVVSDSRESHLH